MPASYRHLYMSMPAVLRELRGRQHFTKPSVKRRDEVIKAAYRQKMRDLENK